MARYPKSRGIFTLAIIAVLLLAGSAPALAKGPPVGGFTATPLSPSNRISAVKNRSSNAAGRGDLVNVIVKLEDAPLATYDGTVPGLAATNPQANGKDKLDPKSPESTRYRAYLKGKQDAFAARARAIRGAVVNQRFDIIFGGIAMTLPSNQIGALGTIPGVTAIYPDNLRQPETDSSPSFIGATTLYPQLGGTLNAGKGVIFGVLDTGVWPEHPSFADNGNLAAPPPKADGTPRTCNFGDNPLTPANDPFVCNHKLIGGAPFLATYLSDPARAAGEVYHTARDSEGHGTHTASTAAGDPLASANVLGVDRGPLNGIAPGAWVSVYRVCGVLGCFDSDSAAAVQQAILDGVNVINFSISGGTDPFSDPVELAFLDAYAAGVFVAASAGNSGPTASTANHLSPWVTTVAASTQRRAFESTLTLNGSAGTATFTGASITAGINSSLPVVLASAAPYNDVRCLASAPPGTFTGKIVACQRGVNARVDKGFNVKQGGAAGMILYNPSLADVETDNHWLPTVHLADGTQFLAFMAANTGVTGSFTAGTKVNGQGDVMAAFSSRGPAGNFIKPDVTAPGVEILAGHTPTPDTSAGGPPGEYFQAIAGTSMSSPHTAGSAILLKALHPTWSPGQIKSALMTTGITKVVKEDLTTPADPFDMGAGRLNLTVAGTPGLTFDETAARMAALGNDPINAVQLNIPSINAPVMPGQLTAIRTATNVTGASQAYEVRTTAPAGSSITVQPSRFGLDPGQSIALAITIRSAAPTAQYFGEVRLVPRTKGLPTLHLPVAFVTGQGAVSLASSCNPTSIAQQDTSTCTVTATNNSFDNTTVDLKTTTNTNLQVISASGATVVNPFLVVKKNVALAGAQLGSPTIAPGELFGYIPLDAFGVTPIAVGDEDILNFAVPSFVYNGQTYSTVGVDSNGYLVVGGGTSEDNNCCNLTQIPDPARPNNVLAPFWTDLDGTGAPGIFATTLTDGVNSWLVIEWRVNVFGTNSGRHFQVWIGVDATEDITFAYDPAALPANPNGQPFLVGAENGNGSGGQQLPAAVLPTQDLRVTGGTPIAGESVSYTVTVQGVVRGTGQVTNSMNTPAVAGTTIVTNLITVQRR